MPKVPPVLTFGQEIEEAVRTWYRVRNMPIPPEELRVCREIDAIEEAEYKKLTAEPAKPKPVYGTPEFWKDWWAKKKAKNECQSQATEGSLTGANSSTRKEAGETSVEPKKRKPSVPKSAKQTGQASQS